MKKNKIINFFRFTSRSNEVTKKIEQTLLSTQQEGIALHLLSPLISNHPYFPWTSSSVSPLTICYLLNDISINERRKIIEFGAGLSTIIIGRFLKQLGGKRNLISVESNENWIKILQSEIEKEDLVPYITLIHAPLGESPYRFKNHSVWYDTVILEKEFQGITFDMVIVDGPQGTLPYSRYGALPFIKQFLAPLFSIILDDTNRIEEQEIFNDWTKIIPNSVVYREARFSKISIGESFCPTPFLLKQLIYP